MKRRVGYLCLVAVGSMFAAATAGSAHRADTLEGSYRVTLGVSDLVRAGAPTVAAADDTGTWALTIVARRWTLRQAHAPDQNAFDRGAIVLTGNRVGFTLLTSDGAAHRVFLGTFSWIARDGTLRFALVADQFPTSLVTVLIARRWKRVR